MQLSRKDKNNEIELPNDILVLIAQRDIESNYKVFPLDMSPNTPAWRKQATLFSMIIGICKWLLVSKNFRYLIEKQTMEHVYKFAWGDLTRPMSGKISKTRERHKVKIRTSNWWRTCRKKCEASIGESCSDKGKYMSKGKSEKNSAYFLRLKKICKQLDAIQLNKKTSVDKISKKSNRDKKRRAKKDF